MTGRRDWLWAIVAAGTLLAGFALKDTLLLPPSPPAQAAPGAFDADRALARLERILGPQHAHPVDSEANDDVRERLMDELRAIGLEPQVREAMDCSGFPRSRTVSCSRVRNVVSTLGSGPGRHLLLNSHYDSTPTGPGAADDGLGVATMLEIAANLRVEPPPRPVTFLFNEGEEFGLNGANAFIRGDPLADRVDSLVNIEARGVSGPALMFETSYPNAAALALYAGAARRPYANSLSMDFARLIPNTTDAVKFRPRGWTFLNYSIIGNETRYHTSGDTIAALDRASFHHVGSEVLAATRALAATPRPSTAATGTAAFTDVAGRLFLRLPLPVAAVGLALLVLAALFLAWRRKALGKPLLLTVAITGAGIATACFVSVVGGLLRAGDFYRAYPLVSYLALYAFLLCAMAAVRARWGAGCERERLSTAAWLLILLFGGAVSLVLPGASIFFLVAPALTLTGLALAPRLPRPARALALIAAIVQFVMFAELLALIEMLLVDGPLWAVAPIAALAALPFLIELEPAPARRSAAVFAVAGAILWSAAMVLPRASAERPAAFTIDYFRDGSRGAHWAVASKQAPLPADFPGEWRKQVLPYSPRTRWVAPAPLLDIPRPSARLLRVENSGNGRRAWLALSPSGANAIAIRFEEKAAVEALGLPGQAIAIPAEGEPERALLRCSGRACKGMVIEVRLADRNPVVAELFATRFALPPQGKPLADKRPTNAHPQYGPNSSIRLHRVRF